MKLHIHKPFDLAIFTSRFFPKRNENIDPLKKKMWAQMFIALLLILFLLSH